MIHIFVLILVFVVFGSALWSGGAIWLLDYIPSDYPVLEWYRPIGNTFTHLLSWGFGYEWGSKLYILLVLFAAGYLGVLFAREAARLMKVSDRWNLLIIESIGAYFFITNPFAYERILVQPLIYMGIIALGYGIYFFLFTSRVWMSGISLGLALATFPHASYMILVIIFLVMIFFMTRKAEAIGILQILLAILLVNLNWLIGLPFGVESIQSMQSFELSNFLAFATQAIPPLDVFSTNLLLYGFWGEQYDNHFIQVGILSSFWYVAGILVLVLSIFGMGALFRIKKYQIAGFLTVLIAVSLVFGVGVGSSSLQGFTMWMAEHIPYWQGYREPQKWIGLVMIGEGILFLVGIAWFVQRYFRDRVIAMVGTFAIWILMFVWSPGSISGFHGQLRTTVVPSELPALREELVADASVRRILVLPWHSYMGCEWVNRPTIPHPAHALFRGLPIIVADNIEVGAALYTNSSIHQQSRDIESFLDEGNMSILYEYDVSHILILTHCADSDISREIIAPLVSSGGLREVKTGDYFELYELKEIN